MKSISEVLLILITAYFIFESVQGQNQSGFISLDCGLVPTNTTYVEKATNLTYKSDADYIDTGSVGRISEELKSKVNLNAWTLRSFPEGQRNCYNLVNLTINTRYLIRGSFMYGNYDGLNETSTFDLYVGPNKWTSVSILEYDRVTNYELIHFITQDRLQICLVKTGDTIPFISSLELRPLHDEIYVMDKGSLILFGRYHFSEPTIRYDEDVYDRIWEPTDILTNTIGTDLPINTSNSYDIPQLVAQTAAIPDDPTQPLTLNLTFGDNTTKAYIYMHFAEIQDLTDDETRAFQTSLNGNIIFSYLSPKKLRVTTVYNTKPRKSQNGYFNYSFEMTSDSTLPPLVNAFEMYKLLELLELDTDQDEVIAMVNIKKTYELNKKISWQGDPCGPQLYRWEGLNCSYSDSKPPRIISLNLTESKLNGTITSEISKLTQLIELDLSRNDLSGEIPAFFADMKSLKLINLSGNPNLRRTIPDSLQQRLKSKSLTLILDENQIPVKIPKSKNVPIVAIAAPVAGVFALLVIVAIFFVVRGRKQKSTDGTHKTPGPSSFMTKERRITYPEVLKVTNNLEKVLGKGGFGIVYHGNLDDAQVAVKALSHSSAQGYKEFKAEVELLLRVHHRHLVRLVGYCDDGDNLALIYEYMANGDLRENMSGLRGGHVLTWGNRMQIAVEAAQGLEYLHNGCTPPIVHRDVKTTNILLNEHNGAKLADFGLSRSFPIDGEAHVSTVVAGTPGYLDPEYYRTNLLSETSDVYSFGVVLLEIITNQPVINNTRERPHISEWVGIMLSKGDIKSIIDPKLMGDYDTNGAWKIVELAMACVNPSSNMRPTMAHVVVELNECVALENARRQGSEKMYSMDVTDYSLSSTSDFVPGAR